MWQNNINLRHFRLISWSLLLPEIASDTKSHFKSWISFINSIRVDGKSKQRENIYIFNDEFNLNASMWQEIYIRTFKVAHKYVDDPPYE